MARYYAARVDANQKAIMAAFREVGATVVHIGTVKAGCPDLLVGFRGVNFLVEVKVPKTGSGGRAGKLSTAQEEWRDGWRGEKPFVVRTTEDVLLWVVKVGVAPTKGTFRGVHG